MQIDRLEEFIKTNRKDFDQLEPSAKAWENISGAKSKTKIIRLNKYLLRIAAVIAVVAVTLAVLLKTNILAPGDLAQNTSDPELKELIEAEAFYAHQVNGKLDEIRKCYYTYPELKQEIETDLTELQVTYDNLKTDLQETISNKMVIEAMIENNRILLKLVDQVLVQIKC